jgi:DNA-binding transcriptional LysR family regulator
MELMSPGVDLGLIETFRVVVERGGVGAAAKALFRTQPAITARLKALEQQLKAPVFQRVGRRLVLTPLGRLLHDDCRELERLKAHMADAARSAAQGTQSGVLRVGLLPTIGVHLLAPALPRLLGGAPALRVELRPGLYSELEGPLQTGEIDLLLAIGPVPRLDRVTCVRLGKIRARAVVRRKDPSPGNLSGRPLLAYGPTDDPFFSSVWSWFERRGLADQVRIRVSHIQTLKALVQAGAGVCVLPDYTVVEPDLKAVPVPGMLIEQPVVGLLRTRLEKHPLLTAMLEHLRRGL